MDIAALVLDGMKENLRVNPTRLTDHLYKDLRLDDDDLDDFILDILKQLNVEMPPDADMVSRYEQSNPDERDTVAGLIVFVEWCVVYNEKLLTYRDAVRMNAAKPQSRILKMLQNTPAMVLVGTLCASLFGILYTAPNFARIIILLILLVVVVLFWFGTKRRG